MRPSLRLGAIFGIPIGLHWSIAIIAGLFTVTLAGTVLPAVAPGYLGAADLVAAVAVAAALLASIIAHELGHSVVAKNNNVGVEGITLFALGGVAKLEREPDTPGAAARIALAGPAVSVAIGVAALVASAFAGAVGTPALAVAALSWLGIINLVMAVFNMVPALPLDGGRVLQALMWRRSGDRNRATISAASVGRYLGWAIVAFGLWQFLENGSGLWTMVIGWFILTSAKAEAMRARFQLRRQQWPAPRWPGYGPTEPASGQPTDPWSSAQWPPPPLQSPGPPPPAQWQSGQWPPAGPTTDVINVDGHRVR